MEVYFKDLISNESSLDKLAADLAMVEQGADEFAKTLAENASEESRRELAGRVSRIKETCRRLKNQAIGGARATDKLLRKHPYAALGAVLALGILIGTRFRKKD
jgi:ElaB/YqjD/DUF883 family membrane-anchored ribosome-binding protein